jgi:hypothetical protein
VSFALEKLETFSGQTPQGSFGPAPARRDRYPSPSAAVPVGSPPNLLTVIARFRHLVYIARVGKLPERECVLRYDKVSWARGIILFSVVLTGTLFCNPALSQNPDSSGNTPKIQRSEEKCIKPPPLFDVNEFPGPIKKTAAYVSRKLERKTVPQPPRRPGNTICALEPRQRFALFVSDSSDRVSFAGRAFTTGWAQFRNDEPKLGQGTKGYAKRYGVATMDQFSKGFFTTFLYPSIFKEDPRYYRMGQGPFQNRLFHAMSHVMVAHQNSGIAMFNFSEWFGVTTSVALRNLYHPDRLRGFRPAALSVETSLVSDIGTDIFREFWPEISRKLKIPFVSRDRSHDENH